MSTAKDVGKNASNGNRVTAIAAKQKKQTKTVEVSLDRSEKPEKGAVALTKELITNPPESVLKPFREAAKRLRNQAKSATSAKAAARGKSFLAKQPAKGKKWVIDLRVHAPGTVGYFSSGGMPPGASLARLAAAKGVDVLGVADYYNAEYIDIVQQTLGKEDLTILPSVVICCRIAACQEVFLLCVFPEGTPSATIYDMMEALDVPKSAYGNRNYCVQADLGTIIQVVESRGGLIIPSRCDKTPFRQLAIPSLVEDYGFHTFDLAHPDSPELFKGRWPNGEFTFLSFSSATALGQIGNRVGKLRLTEPGFEGIRKLAARRV